ncbi:MAG: right-handed parallel beta-helix repeat-containing protein [Terrimicrobiaceae bacterium]
MSLLISFLSFALLLGVSAPCRLLAAEYFVDYGSGDDGNSGKSEAEAWKHAPGDSQAGGKAGSAVLEPGDVVQFRGGVIYRGEIKIPASGTPEKRIVYRGTGWGEGRAILDGSEVVPGWKKCGSAEEVGGNPGFQNLYFTEVAANSPFLLNLHETNAGTSQDEFLWISQDPNPADPFFHDRKDSFYPVTKDNLTTTSITDPMVFASEDSTHYQGASLLIWVSPNFTRRFDILSYDPATRRVTFADIGNSAIYPDGRDQFFAIYNSFHVIDKPGEYAVGEPDATGKRRIVLWPYSPVDLDKRISQSVRVRGFDLGKESHIHIEGFEIRKFAGAEDSGGCGIATAGRGVGSKGGYLLKNNRILHNMSGGRGLGGIYLDDTVDAMVEDNEILWNKDHRAIFVTGGENIIIQNNDIAYAGRTALVMYTGKRSQILNNRISNILGTHANAMTFYIASENLLVAGNIVTNSTTPITFQDSGPLYFFNNITDGGGKYKNVSEWPNTKRGPWATGQIVFANNTFVNADAHSSLNLGKDPDKTYAVINNILDGLGTNQHKAPGIKVIHTHNIYTALNTFQAARYGWEMGEGEVENGDLAALFVNPTKLDFRPAASSTALKAGTDITAYFPKDVFPDLNFDELLGITKPANIGANGQATSPGQ